MKSIASIPDLPGALALACALAVFVGVALDRPEAAGTGGAAMPASLTVGVAAVPVSASR